jgi:LysM repeat protein
MKRIVFFYALSVLILSSCGVKKLFHGRDEKSNAGKAFTPETYIDRFKYIAIAEMDKNGIPASITLAQGLLESGNGNSDLAIKANNHFGIKCNGEWNGKKIYKDDDEKNECFRVYGSAEQSFVDHSEFLKRKRYASLFDLKKDDYKGWAKGLKEAGYATNPKYPDLLINLIERYQLYRFDGKDYPADRVKREDRVITEIATEKPQETEKGKMKSSVSMKIYEVKEGDTLYSIAKTFGLSVADLKTLNNLQSDTVNIGQLLLVAK